MNATQCFLILWRIVTPPLDDFPFSTKTAAQARSFCLHFRLKNVEKVVEPECDEDFPCSYQEDIRVLDVPCLHFYPPLDKLKYGGLGQAKVS
ncbi:hypothetical protein Tco_0469474 [Tanacetum coccineum]